ncbi:MAG: hypothetical protein ABIH42_07820 [Planctomycetota bacterium]
MRQNGNQISQTEPFGWNSIGMGINRKYEILEILLVSHGGMHNDTICMAEHKIAEQGILDL